MALLTKSVDYKYIGGAQGSAYVPGRLAVPKLMCSGWIDRVPTMPGERRIGPVRDNYTLGQAYELGDTGIKPCGYTQGLVEGNWDFPGLGTTDCYAQYMLNEYPKPVDVGDPRIGRQVVAQAVAVLYREGFFNFDQLMLATLRKTNKYLSDADLKKLVMSLPYNGIAREMAGRPIYAIGVELPAAPAAPAINAVSPTLSQRTMLMNDGWNSTSRSRNQLQGGRFYEHKVNLGTRAVFTGLGQMGMDSLPMGMYPVGVLSDASGTWAVEAGVKVHLLRSALAPTSTVRIFREAGGIACVVTSATGATTAWRSSAVQGAVYVYTKMFTGNDSIKDFALADGAVQYGAA